MGNITFDWLVRSSQLFVKALDQQHKYGCLLAVLPDPVRKEISDWVIENVQDEHLFTPDSRELRPHCTILYGFRTDDEETVQALRALLTRHGPISLTLGMQLSTFPAGKDGTPLIVEVDSSDLHELNATLRRSFDAEVKFPEYKPHLTLAYLTEEAAGLYAEERPPFLGTFMQLDQVEWASAAGDRETIPLSMFAAVGGFFDKAAGEPCQPGETSAQTECVSESGENARKPKVQREKLEGKRVTSGLKKRQSYEFEGATVESNDSEIKVDGKTVGRTNLLTTTGLPGVGFTSDLIIDKEYRGLGLGHQLYHNLVSQAREMGLEVLFSDNVRKPATDKIWQALGGTRVTQQEAGIPKDYWGSGDRWKLVITEPLSWEKTLIIRSLDLDSPLVSSVLRASFKSSFVSPFRNRDKAMSWLNDGGGGALVPPPSRGVRGADLPRWLVFTVDGQRIEVRAVTERAARDWADKAGYSVHRVEAVKSLESSPFCGRKDLFDDPIKVHLPDLKQHEDYTCGAAAMEAICEFFGVGPETEDDFVQLLRSDPDEGTPPERILALARRLGLQVDSENGRDLNWVRAQLDQERPVLVLIQAWYDDYERADYVNDEDGHYVVAVGYDAGHVYFEDPSLKGDRGYIANAEFEARWHDEARGQRYERWGAVIWKPHTYERIKSSPFCERKRLSALMKSSPFTWRTKDQGQPCKQGETSARTECVPLSGEVAERGSLKDKPQRRAGAKPKASRGQMAGAKRVGTGKDAKVVMADGTAAPKHITPAMVAPQWTEVQVSLDPKSDVLVTGRDAKGRGKAVYSDKFHMKTAAWKFAKTEEGLRKFDQINQQNQKNCKSKDQATREAADCTWLLQEQGTRPGGEGDTKGYAKFYEQPFGPENVVGEVTIDAKGKQKSTVKLKFGEQGIPVRDIGAAEQLMQRRDEGKSIEDARYWLQSFGATTLEARHVVEAEDGVRLQFMGKEGVWHDHKVRSPELAKMLLERKKTAGQRGGKLFETNAEKLRKYVGTLDGGKFVSKDMRTMLANRLALAEIDQQPDCCADEKSYKAAVKGVAEKVSRVLGNDPAMALKAYIDPSVFGVWKANCKECE